MPTSPRERERAFAARPEHRRSAIAPGTAPQVDATVLICTYNRAQYLARTLDSLAAMPANPGFSWNVLVVDNNSSDESRHVVMSRAGCFPVPLRYLFEGRQGKSNALEHRHVGGAGQGHRVHRRRRRRGAGLDSGPVRPLLDRADIDYTGGPVRPIWGGPRPAWLDETGNLGGTIAVKDHGSRAFVFEDERKTPLGVNMAVRRSLIERIGGSVRTSDAMARHYSARNRRSSSTDRARPAPGACMCRRWCSITSCRPAG